MVLLVPPVLLVEKAGQVEVVLEQVILLVLQTIIQDHRHKDILVQLEVEHPERVLLTLVVVVALVALVMLVLLLVKVVLVDWVNNYLPHSKILLILMEDLDLVVASGLVGVGVELAKLVLLEELVAVELLFLLATQHLVHGPVLVMVVLLTLITLLLDLLILDLVVEEVLVLVPMMV